MARKRLIDTEGLYFDTELAELLGDRGLHLYIRLWGIAEDWGGYEPRYSDIALKMGALKFTETEVEAFIKKLIGAGKVIEYAAKDKKCHWLSKLLEHQGLKNPAPPRLPLPKWIKCTIATYKSGKKFAKYEVIASRLPVGYQNTTSSPNTDTVTVTDTVTDTDTGAAKAASSPQSSFVESWALLYKSETGKPFKADRKDYILAAKLLKDFGEAEVLSRAKILFAACKSRSLWFTKNGLADFTIGTLSSRFNSLIENKSMIDEAMDLADELKKKREEAEAVGRT